MTAELGGVREACGYIDIDIAYCSMTRDVEFEGDSLSRIREFPKGASRALGFQIEKVQHGEDPDDWKPMSIVGAGVREIRLREDGNAYRALYVTRLGDAVYVLHAFVKKTQQTARSDIDLGRKRYAALVRRLNK